jgi:hypothetical protein
VPQVRQPPRFLHDRYFFDYSAAFAITSVGVGGDLPGRLGLTESGLSAQLPGTGFLRNGVPFQPGAYSWLGDNGESIRWMSDRLEWRGEPLGFPPSGADDPILLPSTAADTVHFLVAPLLTAAPATVASWRSADTPDSLHAVARHANGPSGFSHTGGRFHGPLGRGWEFDGQFFRVFSDGQIDLTRLDGHTLDLEARSRVADYPVRLRFRQNRGNRFQSFRWQATADRAHLFYLLSHADFELAVPAANGEWLLHAGLRHEDQELINPRLAGHRQWFNRTYAAELSRLWTGPLSGWLKLTGDWRRGHAEVELPDQKRGGLSAGMWVDRGALDFSLTGAVASQTDYDLVWRVATAARLSAGSLAHVTASAGRSGEPPSFMRRLLPAAGDTASYFESGNASLAQTIHETASLSLGHNSDRLRVALMAAAGRSRHLAVWQPSGDIADSSSDYHVASADRDYSGAGATLAWQPLSFASFSGSIDHVLTNDWSGVASPSYIPDDAWHARLEMPLYFESYNLHLTPLVYMQGAAGGTLPDEYATAGTGFDFRIKGLLIFWRLDNISDEDYRFGGPENAYDRHYEYGFRWEFWN